MKRAVLLLLLVLCAMAAIGLLFLSPAPAGFLLTPCPSELSSTQAGTWCWDSQSHGIRYYDGANWQFWPAANSTPQPTPPTPAPTPTGLTTPSPVATATPTATATPVKAYFIDSAAGSDSNDGLSSGAAWQNLSKVQTVLNTPGTIAAGTQFLFKDGGSWSGMLTIKPGTVGTSANRIIFSDYGGGARPIIDATGQNNCFNMFEPSASASTPFAYITIQNFECKNSTYDGIVVDQSFSSSTQGAMPGITIQNNYIHNTGTAGGGCCATGNDPGGYHMGIKIENDSYSTANDGVRILNNIVSYAGGHNAIQVHGDIGSPLISGNTVTGWNHNGIDVKMVTGAVVTGNVVQGPANAGAAFYIENTRIASADVTWTLNAVVGPVPNGLECEGGGGSASNAVVCKAYNNTVYGNGTSGTSLIVTGGGCTQPITWDVRNNILDSTHPVYEPSTCANRSWTWNYNDDCALQASCTSKYTGANDLTRRDPLFVAAPTDLRLQAGSTLIGAGQGGLTTSNNIGAY